MTMTTSSDRAVRQRDLVPPVELANWHVLVVGVGAVGRQVALQLATMGTGAMTLVDHDTVAVENLAVQGYRPHEIGQPKVEATANACRRLLPEIGLDAHAGRFTRSAPLDLSCLAQPQQPKLAVFACVDSMSGRRLVFDTVRNYAHLLIDGRMAGETLRVVTAVLPAEDTYYATTLFDDSRAQPLCNQSVVGFTAFRRVIAAEQVITPSDYDDRLTGLLVATVSGNVIR